MDKIKTVEASKIQKGNTDRNMSDYYSLFVYCTNCDYEGCIYIPLGKLVDMASCPHCECVSLKQKIERF